jgi:hypothetical protein
MLLNDVTDRKTKTSEEPTQWKVLSEIKDRKTKT